MKLLFAAILIMGLSAFVAQDKSGIPSVNIKTLEGQTFNTGSISNDGKPVIISFWATWCSPCKKELNAISDLYDDWVEETGVKLVAISIDDARNVNKVAPTVNANAWDFDVYIDQNQDFKRAMNVNNVPHTFLLDGEGKIVYQHNSYAPGDEEKLYKLVQKVARGESLEHN